MTHDIAAIYDEIAMRWRETRDQIERQAQNPARFSKESVQIAKRRLEVFADAVRIIRAVKDNPQLLSVLSQGRAA